MADGVDSKARDISETGSRKQTDDSIGATKGIKHELKKRGDSGFQDVAQSGIENQTEAGLNSIRGAGSIHSFAWQGGVKAESDSNALRATINKVSGYVLPKSSTVSSDGTTKAVRTTAMGWAGKGFGKAADYVSDRLGLAKESPVDTTTKSSEKPPHASANNEGDKTQKSSFDHDTPPKSSMDNSTTEAEKVQGQTRSKITSMGGRIGDYIDTAADGDIADKMREAGKKMAHGNIPSKVIGGALIGASSLATLFGGSSAEAAEIPITIKPKPVVAGGESAGQDQMITSVGMPQNCA